jgi:hypothetical protein
MWPVVPVSTVLMVCSIDIVAYEVEDMQVEVANITWRTGPNNTGYYLFGYYFVTYIKHWEHPR